MKYCDVSRFCVRALHLGAYKKVESPQIGEGDILIKLYDSFSCCHTLAPKKIKSLQICGVNVYNVTRIHGDHTLAPKRSRVLRLVREVM